MANIGFIGMGLMGVPMSKRLFDAGHQLMVFNRNAEKCNPLAAYGMTVAEDISELASFADIVMICVSDTDAVVEVAKTLFLTMKSDRTIVDFSSISPSETVKLHHEAAQLGIRWVDAPVSGGVAGAEAGTLAIMAGGDEHEVEALKPLLAALSQRVTYMGSSGAGQTTKVCNQMIVSCNLLVMAEAMAMAKQAGVDASRIPEALKGGFADSTPLQLTGSRMAEQTFEPVKWHVKTLLKDLDMANQLAQTLGSAIPMSGLGAELMRQHGAQGNLDKDPSTLVCLYEPDLSGE